jgi:plastocyanin
MKILLSLVGVFIISILLFSSQAFAIDFRDSTGYTPSWAVGKGYHSVLLECTEISSTTSRDGNWCMEWVAYVLDQGIENFPESTKEVSSKSKPNPLSERVCSPNKLCAFPGEYLRYKNTDTYDDFSEIAIVDFKEKVNDDNIRVFIDGWGSKPLTYNLNLKTGVETHSEYTGVNRPFNLLEPIPMKIGQKVSQSVVGYYDATIEDETTTNLKNFGLMDMERTIMGAKTDYGNGDLVIYAYDKETGVLITLIEKYTIDGKQYTAGLLLTDTNIFSAPTKITSIGTSSQISDYKITEKQSSSSGSKARVSIPQGTSFPGCETTKECYIPYEVTVDVGGVVTWTNDDSAAHTVTAGSPAEGPSQVFDSSLFMAGTSFEHKFEEAGSFDYFCMVHPWMLGIVTVVEETSLSEKSEPTNSISVTPEKEEKFLDMNEKEEKKESVPETKTTTTQSDDESNSDSGVPAWAMGLAAFVVFGIPIIIIALIIWKIKRGRAKKQAMRDSSWKGV